MAESKNVLPVEVIANRIYIIRGQKVMLDRDLAQLYGVETRVLVQAVKRNTATTAKPAAKVLMDFDIIIKLPPPLSFSGRG